ncbi:MAG: disulfide oxidoreductase [Trueperaceae bacterium]|nr:disulfide oxidoreductase [Trueperaceae bacterium]
MTRHDTGAGRTAMVLYLAWLVSLVATLGSLWFSEVRGFVPCTLCWYQRILMYPLAIQLGIAAWRGDVSIIRYALPLTTLGGLIAAYHVLVQKIPDFGFASTCRSGVPCNAAYIEWFGWVTIPVLSLSAFVLITILLGAVAATRR